MHGIFEEFFIIFSQIPFILFHHLAILVERIRIIILWISGEELTAFTFRFLHEFRSQRTRQFTCLAQQHIPDIISDHTPTFLAFFHGNHIHHRQILNVLAERSYQRRITYTRPYISYFVKQLDKQLILRHKRQVTFCLIFIDGFQIGLQVGHKATHHTTRKSRTDQQGVHQAVFRTDVQTKKIVHKFLNQCTHLHICFHIHLRNLETCIFQHCLHAQQVSVSRTP